MTGTKYLKLFETHAEYQTYINGQDSILPNVSYCEDNNDVHYNPWTWAETYLTTVALENGTISFNIWQSMGTDMITSISYSTDNGETWTTTANQDNKSENLTIDVNVNTGDTILWKGTATQTGYYDADNYGDTVGSFFSSTCEFDVKGNVMSLLYGDNYKGQTILEEDGAICCLFYDYYEEKTCGIVNAKDLSLPATTLAEYCYKYMFYDCTSLVTAPELPATTLAQGVYWYMFEKCAITTAPSLPATTLTENCYNSMFDGCTSLTTAPELPATILTEYCYYSMFAGCTSLVTAPSLPATTLAEVCYYSMFAGCTSLVTAPSLPATTLVEDCYNGMFRNCTALVNAPVLPATTLADGCYNGMFIGCTSLVNAPELPATTLAVYCYQSMFSGCTNLTTAPELPATTLTANCYYGMFQGCTSLTTAPDLLATILASRCYYNMFNGCTSLNYIKAMFTTTPSGSSPNYYTTDWVNGVSATGTFVKNSAAQWNVSGVHGIPSGWTVETASE